MYNACFPCIARGALDAACLATADEKIQLSVLKTVLAELAILDPACPPPLMARFIQRTVAQMTGLDDPYAPLKAKYNTLALDLYPWLQGLKDKTRPEKKGQGGAEQARSGQVRDNRFETGVRLAVAGNIIDFGTASTVGKEKVMATISHALDTDVNGSIEDLRESVDKADRILWLADNAGEIVFDRLLLEEMDRSKVTYVVRGGPVQNDATLADAREAGLDRMVRLMDSGAAIPGTLLDHCSDAFVRAYDRADLIISKGQGNFETLAHDDSRIFFLFKVKCPVVADHAGCDLGDVVVMQGGHLRPQKRKKD